MAGSRTAPDAPALLVGAALMAWVLATLAGSHTDPGLGRVRRLDPTGLLLPDWRFFAPNPSVHDLHLLYRVRTTDGTTGEWRQAAPISPRHWSQTFWFSARRRSKAVFDAATEVERMVGRTPRDPAWIAGTPACRALARMVEAEVRGAQWSGPEPVGYQFALLRTAGHDGQAEPEYILTSGYTPLVSGPRPTARPLRDIRPSPAPVPPEVAQ